MMEYVLRVVAGIVDVIKISMRDGRDVGGHDLILIAKSKT